MSHTRAPARSRGNSVTYRAERVGRVFVHLPDAAGGNDDVSAAQHFIVVADVNEHAGGGAVRCQNVHEVGLKEKVQVLPFQRQPAELHCRLFACCVTAAMDDAAHPMPAFTCNLQIALRIDVERDLHIYKRADVFRPLLDKHLHRFHVAQSGAGLQCIVDVVDIIVIRRHHCRDAALCKIGVAFVDVGFGDQRHLKRRIDVQRRVKACDAGADDDDVEIVCVGFKVVKAAKESSHNANQPYLSRCCALQQLQIIGCVLVHEIIQPIGI